MARQDGLAAVQALADDHTSGAAEIEARAVRLLRQAAEALRAVLAQAGIDILAIEQSSCAGSD
ncbi:MAG: hypothetical protein ACYC5M_05290 [Anaerolineae bacterium]